MPKPSLTDQMQAWTERECRAFLRWALPGVRVRFVKTYSYYHVWLGPFEYWNPSLDTKRDVAQWMCLHVTNWLTPPRRREAVKEFGKP